MDSAGGKTAIPALPRMGKAALKLGMEDCVMLLNSGRMVQHLSFQHWKRRPMPREGAGSPELQLCPAPSGHRSG